MPPPPDHPPLADFLSSVPSPLTFALVQLAPAISVLRNAIQISTWSATSWHHSWLALAAWWAVCLLVDRTLRYDPFLCIWIRAKYSHRNFLPFVVFGLIAAAQWRRKPSHSLPPPTTEITLQNVVTDLTIIQSSIPTISWSPPSKNVPKLFRAAFVLYVPYVFITFFVSFRVICAIAGTLVLTWRAPWAIIIRTTVWRSAWIRWAVYKSWSIISGETIAVRVMSPQPTTSSTEPVQSLRFLFTIYENQRWWMGLDWTAALLPGERPSWCSASQHPISPPNAFSLPESTSVYLPDGKGGRLKRTATWKWEEPEWRVLVHKDGGGVSRVERPVPAVKEDSPNSSRLLKAAGRLREGSLHTGGGSESNKALTGNLDDHISDDSSDHADEEPLTDADGWVYCDNKWEAQSNKGGMGKVSHLRAVYIRAFILFTPF